MSDQKGSWRAGWRPSEVFVYPAKKARSFLQANREILKRPSR